MKPLVLTRTKDKNSLTQKKHIGKLEVNSEPISEHTFLVFSVNLTKINIHEMYIFLSSDLYALG